MKTPRALLPVLITVIIITLVTLSIPTLMHSRLPWGFISQRTPKSLERGADLRWCRLTALDLRNRADTILTYGFNLRTHWPNADRLPAGFDPAQVLTNAMSPGLGVAELHRQGVTGKGVSVGIIDYPLVGQHPEYADRIVARHEVRGASGVSMHGPAVASLLAGRHCGTAPDARVYYVAVPDPGADARELAEALDWLVEQNRTLPDPQKIRVVSISSIASGSGTPYRNGNAWDQAVERAEKTGMLVIDGTLHHGFLRPCNLDPQAPDDVTRCQPIPTQHGFNLFAGRLMVPVAPRTVAEEYSRQEQGYHYCGLMAHTWGMFGTSWSMPYCAGVLALGWQINPNITAPRMKQLLFDSAYVRPDGVKVINPREFLAAVKQEPLTPDQGNRR
jgi:serine protease AprX